MGPRKMSIIPFGILTEENIVSFFPFFLPSFLSAFLIKKKKNFFVSFTFPILWAGSVAQLVKQDLSLVLKPLNKC